MLPKTWVRREASKLLRDEGDDDPLRTRELEPALEAFVLQTGAAWLLGAQQALDDLDDAKRAELDDAAYAVFSDTMAVRREKRWRRTTRHDHGPAWEPYPYSPPWWDQEVETLFAELLPLQEQARFLVGMLGTNALSLRVEEVPAALRGLASATALPLGEEVVLDVPTGYYDNTPLLRFRRIVFGREGPAEDNARGVPDVHPLQSLLALTIRVQDATGCRQWEALGYLLCNEVPWVPAVEIRTDESLQSVTIRIRHPQVPVEVVATIYKNARRELGAQQRTLHKLTTGWPSKVFEFVSEWQQSHPGRLRWLPIYAAFSARYPAAAYSNPVSLRETFYRERGRRRQQALA